MPAETWQLICTQAELTRACESLAAGEGPVGVDTERASGYRYSNRAYLVQMYRRGSGTFLFDPLGITSFHPLVQAIGKQEWILHAASQDLPSLREIGLVPQQLFDTELGCRLLGLARVGLGTVAAELLNVHLEKAYSASDWSTRPLPQPWLHYAALDVQLLPDLRDAVWQQLLAQDKAAIAKQEFRAVLEMPSKPPALEPWRKLCGNSNNSASTYLICKELWQSRDRLAKKLDSAPGRLLPDASIKAAARANPRSQQELAQLKSFQGRASRTELGRWWQAILRARTAALNPAKTAASKQNKPPREIPDYRRWQERHPAAWERLQAVRAGLAELSEAKQIPIENLLTPSLAREIVWLHPPTTEIAAHLQRAGARPWQINLVTPIFTAAFVA